MSHTMDTGKTLYYDRSCSQMSWLQSCVFSATSFTVVFVSNSNPTHTLRLGQQRVLATYRDSIERGQFKSVKMLALPSFTGWLHINFISHKDLGIEIPLVTEVIACSVIVSYRKS